MATAQNGWPVVPNTAAGRRKLTNLVLPGGPMDHPVLVRAGDVATIARWHVREYHRRVEKIKSAGCWGWNVRLIGDGPDWSNHAAACAWDLNAPDNPDGVPTRKVMTSAQIEQCHALERESSHVLRWGGDWSDPDAMHWEIVGTTEQVARFARKIRNEEANTVTAPTPGQNADAVWDEPINLPDGRTVSARTILAWRDAAEMGTRDVVRAETAEIDAAVSALAADPATLDDPETHPIVRAIRWAANNPPAPPQG